jgi:hypothetical protein
MGLDATSNMLPRHNGLGLVSLLDNSIPRSPASELHSRPSAHELDSGVSASELSSSSTPPPNPGAGK